MKKEDIIAAIQSGAQVEHGYDVESGARAYLFRRGDQTEMIEDQKLVRDMIVSKELVSDDLCQCSITHYQLSS